LLVEHCFTPWTVRRRVTGSYPLLNFKKLNGWGY
jgi:hypothetical protein